jgi:hypothetical protein
VESVETGTVSWGECGGREVVDTEGEEEEYEFEEYCFPFAEQRWSVGCEVPYLEEGESNAGVL